MAPTQKRKSISAADKLEVVNRAKRGESLNFLEKETGYQRSQIKQWMLKENDLMRSRKGQKRVRGGGRRPMYPEIESLIIEWFKKQRDKKLVVNYNSFRKAAQKINKNLETPINNFLCSNKWIRGVCRRNKIKSRKVTHQSQQDNSSLNEIRTKVQNFITAVNQKTVNVPPRLLFNMDETPCYFDMTYGRTLHFQEEKTVDGLDTGHTKNRFTAVLCISAAGKVARTQIILKGLKNIPKVKLPKNIDLVVSSGGSMTTDVMNKWIRNCFRAQCDVFKRESSLLIMDSYGCHLKEEVLRNLKKYCNAETIIIPPKTTSFLQPLDVSINHPFKNALRLEWNNWLSEGPEEFTNKGYRKKPSYQNIVDFVAAAVKQISPEIIKRSFECCGIGADGEKIPLCKLNSRLQTVLTDDEETSEFGGGSGKLTLECEEEETEDSDEEIEMFFQEESSTVDCSELSQSMTESDSCDTCNSCESE